MSEWPVVKLGDFASSCLGKMLDQRKNKGKEEPYLANVNVRWGEFDLSDLGNMRFEEHESERYGLKNGDLVVCEGGEPGRCAIWNDGENFPDMKIQKALHRIRPADGLENYFLFYWFLHSGRRGDLEPYFTGTTIKHLTGKSIAQLDIPLPPIEVQKKMSVVLKTLDDKIALNRKLNETLEGMARALFQSWFVDFDPVKAKLAAVRHGRDPERACMAALSGKLRIAPGKPKLGTPTSSSASVKDIADGDVGAPRGLPTADELDAAIAELESLSPSQQENLAQTAAHFPADFQESELGLVPEGWDVSLSGDHLDVMRGFSYKGAGLSDSGTPMHNLNSVYEGGGYKYEGIKHYTLPIKDKHKILLGDIIVTNTEQGFDHLLIGFGAMVPESFPEGIFSHHIYRVRPLSNSSLTNHFIYHLFLPGRFRSAVAGFSNGTTVNMLPVDGLTKQLLCIPPTGLISDFTAQSRSLRKEQEKLHHQSRTLAELRDTLLPKLLSGELSVGEGESAAENAEERRR